MSMYSTAEGTIQYSTTGAFDTAKKLLIDGGWVNNQGIWIDTIDEISPTVGFYETEMQILIPRICHRNITDIADRLILGGTADVKWTSLDGVFVGGFFGCKEVDLEDWAKEAGFGVPLLSQYEDEEEYDSAYMDWRMEVEMYFLDNATISDFKK